MGEAVNLFTGAFIGGIISSMVNFYLWPAIALGWLFYKWRKLALLLAGVGAAAVTWHHSKLMHDANISDPPTAAMAGDYTAAIIVAMAFALIGAVLREEAIRKKQEKSGKP